ncbi:MAG TPA: dTDP-4-dehydrorhamnose reductase [Steroidobacteraceae bacterium]|nr:dTDP-4-dehydrorhamnose reductase [Steroidobacteraceae bacterium]
MPPAPPPRKILITGAAGQVGRALLAGVPNNWEAVACAHAELDIGVGDAVRDCVRRHRPAVIINAAAYTAVDKAESEPDIAQRINTEGPGHLAAAARECGARLLHISTDFVFDGTASVPYQPDSATHPLSVYGTTKRDGEQAVLQALADRATVVRTAWVYAASGANFLRTMLRVMRANGAARVVADQVGTPTAARSLAQALWRIADDPQIRGIHHWTDAGVASWYDFAVAIAEEGAELGLLPAEIAVTPITTADYPTPAHRPAYSVLDKRSLAPYGLAPIHWRKRLRAVLKEISSV